VVISSVLYAFLTREIEGADVNMVAREIETIDKLWLNGYLGHFFRLNYFTLFNGLLLPIIVFDLINIKKANQVKKAFLLVYVLCLILVGAKGFFNSRYTLTLFPISSVYLIVTMVDYLKVKKMDVVLRVLPYLITTICFFWFVREVFIWTAQSEPVIETVYDTVPGYKVVVVKGNKSSISKLMNALIFDAYPNYKVNKGTAYKTIPEFDIYDDIVLHHNKTKGKVLVNNLPGVFYHTKVKGVYYWAGDDLIFDDKGRYHLFKGRNLEEVKRLLVDELQVSYIYTSESYNLYSKDFNQFLQEHCTLIKEGKYAYQFFQIN
jgi:hypothetical protein